MATTFEAFKGKQPMNYCSNPTKDVEVLNKVLRCRICEAPLVLWGSRWRHLEIPKGFDGHLAEIDPPCHYCNAIGTTTHTQEAYYDRTECSRCGGVYGFPIGD